MPSASLLDLIAELADTLREAITPAIEDIQVEPRRTLNPTPPSIDIYPAEQQFRGDDGEGFGEVSGSVNLTIRARVNTTDHDAAQDFLIELNDEISDIGVAAIVEEDQTLNGLATSVEVTFASGIGFYEDIPGTGALPGCHWTVKILRAFS